ncbi:MAG: hypothetical protein F6K15_32795 [Okeania sp. SIO2B3]|nr:hypothetical protein [Okeania sp. SIO2B3]
MHIRDAPFLIEYIRICFIQIKEGILRKSEVRSQKSEVNPPLTPPNPPLTPPRRGGEVGDA